MLTKRFNSTGYTLVELVLAMALFSFVLLVIIGSITGLYRIYRATEGIRDTQQQARTVSEELTRAARKATHIAVGPNAVCFFYRAAEISPTPKTSSEMFSVEGPTQLTQVMMHKQWANASFNAGTGCASADPNYTNARSITNGDVAVVLFEPSTSILTGTFSTLLNYHLRIVSARTIAADLDPAPPAFDPLNPFGTGPRCLDGRSYCTMTSISNGIQARAQLVGGQ